MATAPAGRRTVIIAGAGIGGLTAALLLSRGGFRVQLLERAAVFEAIGAGIQITPNASRILVDLGLGKALAEVAVTPEGMDVRAGGNGRLLASADLGAAIAARYGAPWWMVHRADLQAALVAAVHDDPHVTVAMGRTVETVARDGDGVAVTAVGVGERSTHRGAALIGTDGLWSATRELFGDGKPPAYGGRTAWRALLPRSAVPEGISDRRLGLWLGPGAHLVHYPVRAGAALNLVAVVSDPEPRTGWSGTGDRLALIARFRGWTSQAQALVAAPQAWTTWSLADRAPWFGQGQGPLTLLGDAAHPMLPFLAQGGAMAIEDAAVLAKALAARPDDLDGGFRAYEQARARRVAAVQRGARANGRIYHLEGPMGWARDTAMRVLGGRQLVAGYDWIYRFRA
ncbi:FAD-dependent monooxygenase [Phreatobacter stygius]|uniref:FAD-binding domain-containing protein n=1 Tax=Phreatobacter stygius TaxID=1940610 RepID=A0A4D7B4A0_9HYPH|nr:FAD-dependent monooxygenase [Phreatobacter stygius]QCI62837.1 hypothetical protein E8M01_00400 [Phreatobacter stygius]